MKLFKLKYIKIFWLCLLTSLVCKLNALAQEPVQYLGGTSTQASKVRGRLYVDSAFYPPRTLYGLPLRKGAFAYDSINSVFKGWNGSAWAAISGSTDLSAYRTKAQNDLLYAALSHIHAISDITNLQSSLDGKVDKITGKGLSTEDYTTAEKSKLSGIETGAQVNAANTVIDASYVHTDNNYTTTEKTKLSGIAAGATANSSDAFLLANANHTGVQAATTITEDATHRFTTDAEKTTWNSASSTYLPLAGGTMSGAISQPNIPTNAFHLVNKSYVDNLITGITWKNAVRIATTTNITLSGTQTIDGTAVVAGNRVLVKNQTDQTQNGIYTVVSGAWTRVTDADEATELETATVFVTTGTANKNTQWTSSSLVTTVGTDNITFGQIAGAGTYTNGSGLTLTGNVFSVSTSGITNTMLAGSIDPTKITEDATHRWTTDAEKTSWNGKLNISDTAAMLTNDLRTGSIVWPGTIYSTPTNGTVSSHKITFSPSLATQTANTHLAGPTSGGAAVPTFRALVAADIPALADLTATDASLTFSGTYNGTTARTIGLNLGNPNTFTAKQTVQLTTEQLRLAYDASNYGTFTAASNGNLLIASSAGTGSITYGTSLTLAGSSIVLTSGNISTSTTNTSANFYIASSIGLVSSTSTSQYLFGGASNVQFRVGMRGSTATTLTANTNATGLLMGQQGMTEATSGTHALLAGAVFKAPVITDGTAATTNTATLYIDGAPSGITPTGKNYSLKIDAGEVYLGSKINFDATNTAGGTTGAQTINKPDGSVNFAAGASSLVVTNSLVTTSSHVQCVIETDDATADGVKCVIPASGSFTIKLRAAATAETKVAFWVRD